MQRLTWASVALSEQQTPPAVRTQMSPNPCWTQSRSVWQSSGAPGGGQAEVDSAQWMTPLVDLRQAQLPFVKLQRSRAGTGSHNVPQPAPQIPWPAASASSSANRPAARAATLPVTPPSTCRREVDRRSTSAAPPGSRFIQASNGHRFIGSAPAPLVRASATSDRLRRLRDVDTLHNTSKQTTVNPYVPDPPLRDERDLTNGVPAFALVADRTIAAGESLPGDKSGSV